VYPGTVVELSDVVVRDTQAAVLGDRVGGYGVCVEQEARMTVTRAVLERNHEVGAFAGFPDVFGAPTLALSDVVVRDTQAREGDGDSGRGLVAQEGAQVTVARAVFERNREMGVFGASPGTVLGLTDVTVRDTLSQESDQRLGRGLNVQDGVLVTVERAVFEGNGDAAVFAGKYSTTAAVTLLMSDVAVRDTRSRETDGVGGRGLYAGAGAQVTIERATFERNHEIGLAVFDLGTMLTLTEVAVLDTLPRECVSDWCADRGAGTGVGAFNGGQLEATRFVIARSALCGFQLANGVDMSERPLPLPGTADLHEGEIWGQPVGVNLQNPEFDVNRLTDRVLFHDNERNLDSEELPVPATMESVSDE
jgi:hypothetical protein